MTTTPRVLILGIGNVLWADEGFGVRTVEHMYRHYQAPDHVKIMDGGDTRFVPCPTYPRN